MNLYSKMKKFIIFSFLIAALPVMAQEILIPFKSGEKFGLMDESDKVIVEANYDEVEWLGDEYFQAEERLLVNDKIKTDSGQIERNDLVAVKSLLYKGKVLIGPNPYSYYQVMPGMLISAWFTGDAEKMSLNQKQYDNLKGKSPAFFLYNLKGENLSPEGYRRLEFVDATGRSDQNPEKLKYALLFMENFQNEFEMAVFDADEGKIKEFLFQNVTDFKVLINDPKTRTYSLEYKDSNQDIQRKKVLKTSDYFLMEEMTEPVPDRAEILQEMDEDLLAINAQLVPEKAIKSEGFPHYFMENGILKYENDKGEISHVKLLAGSKVSLRMPQINRQKEDVIYKKGNLFGWIKHGIQQEARHDSLAYFGNSQFLICNKINSQLKCGTLDSKGNAFIPMEYDSIAGTMKTYRIDKTTGKFGLRKDKREASVGDSDFENPFYIKTEANIVVYKNGKAGIVKANGNLVLPLEYDEIGMNGMKTRGPAISDFIVLKEGNQYGVIMSNFDSESKQYLQEILEPMFSDFPAFYFKDYYGKKGFHLFGLMDEHGKIQAYASEIGRVFIK